MQVPLRSEDRAVRKYLERHAEPEAQLAQAPLPHWGCVVVVPLHAERAGFLAGYRDAFENGAERVLCIAVVNGRASDAPEVGASNAILLQELTHAAERITAPIEAGAWLQRRERFDVLCIDRASPGLELPGGQGVGLARKIGADVALGLIAGGRVATPWIYCSDADVKLPRDYFVRAAPRASALTFPYRHVPSGDARIDRATALYEASLRYYVVGLAWSGSPWAFECVGSTIAADATSYARVRGFPRRSAAEDFYLLAKLAKQNRVAVPVGDPIEIASRMSARVPFGTGAATSRIAEDLTAGRHFTVYDPEAFALLAAWLSALDESAAAGVGEWSAASLLARARAHAVRRVDRRAAQTLERALACAGAVEGVEAAARGAPPAQRLRRVHEWFDAFRTLKLIHAVRDAGAPNVSFEHAMAAAPFVGRSVAAEDAELSGLRSYLQQREPVQAGLAAKLEARRSEVTEAGRNEPAPLE